MSHPTMSPAASTATNSDWIHKSSTYFTSNGLSHERDVSLSKVNPNESHTLSLESSCVQVDWQQILNDLTSFSPTPQRQSDGTCDCFSKALKTIEELDDQERNSKLDNAMAILELSRESLKACEDFSICRICSTERHLLLYVTILQELLVRYWSLVLAPSKLGLQSVQLKVGDFEIQLGTSTDLSQVILDMDIERAAGCVGAIEKRIFREGADWDSHELMHQQELLRGLRTELEQMLERDSQQCFAVG